MVASIAIKFEDVFSKLNLGVFDWIVIPAVYGHDLIEDTRVTYNDVLHRASMHEGKYHGERIADIIYVLTNEKGKTRKERANDKYYEGIRATPGAVFIKLCDRIANVKYGVMVAGSMVGKYEKENLSFLQSLGITNEANQIIGGLSNPYEPMVRYLTKLFNLKQSLYEGFYPGNNANH